MTKVLNSNLYTLQSILIHHWTSAYTMLMGRGYHHHLLCHMREIKWIQKMFIFLIISLWEFEWVTIVQFYIEQQLLGNFKSRVANLKGFRPTYRIVMLWISINKSLEGGKTLVKVDEYPPKWVPAIAANTLNYFIKSMNIRWENFKVYTIKYWRSWLKGILQLKMPSSQNIIFKKYFDVI